MENLINSDKYLLSRLRMQCDLSVYRSNYGITVKNYSYGTSFSAAFFSLGKIIGFLYFFVSDSSCGEKSICGDATREEIIWVLDKIEKGTTNEQ